MALEIVVFTAIAVTLSLRVNSVHGFQTLSNVLSNVHVQTPRSGVIPLQASSSDAEFDVDTALFCAGLAFDAYVEPDPDSSRWERGVSRLLCSPN